MSTSTCAASKPHYRLPAEWETHQATWLSYPHETTTWPGGIERIYKPYHEFIRLLSEGEAVHIGVNRNADLPSVQKRLRDAGTVMDHVHLHTIPTNDAWCRDHGPCFVEGPNGWVVVNWGFNAWGGKYPYHLDQQVPVHAARVLNLSLLDPGMILEGGAIDVNGDGVLLTTSSCLLNPNRNSGFSKADITHKLEEYFGVEHIIWLEEGIAGDDTDGHVDDITRFVNATTIVTAVENKSHDINYNALRRNREILRHAKDRHGRPFDVIELPMPEPVFYQGERLPASYANFYIANAAVIMPTFGCKQDAEALDVLAQCFDRRVVGVYAGDIIQGLGSFHCLSRQQPEAWSSNLPKKPQEVHPPLVDVDG